VEGIINEFKVYGLAGLFGGAGTILLFFVVKWVLDTTSEIIKQAAKEREVFNSMYMEWIAALNSHTEQAESFHGEVKAAQEHQRREHERMIQILDHVEERTKTCVMR
jgi:hypothetical protein